MTKIRQKEKFRWFVNDYDGLSIMDTLTIAMFIFFILFKFIHIYISINHEHNLHLLSQFNIIMASLDEFMRLITIFYFSEKTLDNTITKIGDIKNKGYVIKEMENIEDDTEQSPTEEDDSEYPISNDLTYNSQDDNIYESDEEVPQEDIHQYTIDPEYSDSVDSIKSNDFVVKLE